MFFNKNENDKCKQCQHIKDNLEAIKYTESINFKNMMYKVIAIILCIGAIGPFLAQCILPFFIDESIQIDSLQLWNQYVSMILGLVALLMSIVSMYLGFKNSDDSASSERRTRNLIGGLDKELREILSDQKQILEAQKNIVNEQRQMNAKIDNIEIVRKKNSDISGWDNKPDKINRD